MVALEVIGNDLLNTVTAAITEENESSQNDTVA